MSNKPKLTVDWFPHSCLHKDSLHIVESHWREKGYTCWFKLLERLGVTPGHQITIEDDSKKLLLLWSQSGLTSEEGKSVFDLFAELGMIDEDLYNEGIIWSDNFVEKVSGAYSKRKGKAPEKPNSDTGNLFPDTENGIPDTEKPGITIQDTTLQNKNIYTVFESWNKQESLVTHRTLTQKFESKIKARLSDGYLLEDILEAVCNYSLVVESDEFYWTHRWGVDDFMLPQNLDRFLTENNPFAAFRKREDAPQSHKDTLSNWSYRRKGK
jgi:hypothetical protein